ncbi:hypothetical protein MRQ47_004476 [Salmonella enterica]|nr:hypothetical protein [Salmonella enterica]
MTTNKQIHERTRRQIAALIHFAMTNTEIAKALGVPVETVRQIREAVESEEKKRR